MKEAQALGYIKSLFEAINHCHALNIVHGDIKPDNIMINKYNMVRLIDFGLSKSNTTGKGKHREIRGTPYYLAPEVLDGLYGNQVDIWAIGIILYTLVSGYLPFQGPTADRLYG